MVCLNLEMCLKKRMLHNTTTILKTKRSDVYLFIILKFSDNWGIFRKVKTYNLKEIKNLSKKKKRMEMVSAVQELKGYKRNAYPPLLKFC